MSIVYKFQQQIKQIQESIKQIQEQCAHPKAALEIAHKGSSGFDYDYEWTEYHCQLCDKKWGVDE